MLTPTGVGLWLIVVSWLPRATSAGKTGLTLFLWLLFTGMVANTQNQPCAMNKTEIIQKIKQIAIEIALQGTQGYYPAKKDYTINLIPGKTFSGYHVLAYYYVSWAISAPKMLSQLQLLFYEEYKLAKQMHNPKQ